MPENNSWIERNESTTVVVFVHGILSSSDTCWRNQRSGCYWPSLVLDDAQFKRPSVFVSGYPADLDSGEFQVYDAADQLMVRLQSTIEGYSPLSKQSLLFVCHSQGGIVVRRMLCSYASQFHEKKVGIVLCASPALGSRWATFLKPFAKLVGYDQGQYLNHRNPQFLELDRDFQRLIGQKIIPDFSGMSLVETRGFLRLPKLVGTASASRYFEWYKIPKSNHSEVVKPDNADHLSHVYLRRFAQTTGFMNTYEQSPISGPVIHDHAAARSNVPHLPYGFFGREDELEQIAGSLAPDARTCGALIDGPGGVGKTALAIRAAELTPPGQFQRIIFLSAKSRELTPGGPKVLANFIVPGYLDMLNELARQLDRAELTKTNEAERPRELQRALQGACVLLIFDNLESLTPTDRDQLSNFLGHLPGKSKAIVTSRRRDETDFRVVRLGKLGKDAALEFIAKLAEDRESLQHATEAERLELYENTGGNPLLIRWVAGQLGRGKCKTIADAVKLLRNAPANNDPLEFIFGDLVESFTDTETKVLAALSHFTTSMEVKFIAELGGLGKLAAQTALNDLTNRALVTGDEEGNQFAMMPSVADFLRQARPEAMGETDQRLVDRAYALAVENGFNHHDRFPELERQWFVIAATLPLFLQGPNERLQTVCNALLHFLDFSGRWDEWLSLELQAEKRAVASQDFLNAGWRAEHAGWAFYMRGDTREVLACADRVAAHWQETKVGARERAVAIRLRGMGHHLAKNYPAAIKAYREAVDLWRMLSPESDVVPIGLNALADAERLAGDLPSAERDYLEALRIAKIINHEEGIATYTGNLSSLALDRENWPAAERLAREALLLAEMVGRKELIGSDCVRLAQALVHQDRRAEALPHAQRAVEIFTALRSPDLDEAREILVECDA